MTQMRSFTGDGKLNEVLPLPKAGLSIASELSDIFMWDRYFCTARSDLGGTGAYVMLSGTS